MKNSLFIILVTLVSTVVFSQTDKPLRGIEKQFNSVLESTKAFGFAVAIVEGDKIIYAKRFGYTDYENKVLVDANTLFAIGSSTKAFTSALSDLHRKRRENKPT